MALGKRKAKQDELFTPTVHLPRSPGHPFYQKLNQVLAEAQFDEFAEKLCAPAYKQGGRPGIPPGVYFRMLLIGYFEGIDSQRGIAWRCGDSFSLRAFLGLGLTEATPEHSSLSVIRQRLPETVFHEVFAFILRLLHDKGLLQGRTVGIDATTLEANAAMKSIVRKETGQNWNEYLTQLAKAEGMENPTAEDLRRMDRKRTNKKVSNQDWHNPHDPEARIARMKDGRTHLAYKAEQAVDLQSQVIVAATVTHADRSDPESGAQTLVLAQYNLERAGRAAAVQELVADKGYHDNRLLSQCAEWQVRTYIPERKQKTRCWTDKPVEYETAFRDNRRRVRSDKGKRLNRWRSERCERTFAHVCETGGGRRAWLRGLLKVTKSYLMRCVAYNLGVLMRKLFGMGKPRGLQGPPTAWFLCLLVWHRSSAAWITRFVAAVKTEQLFSFHCREFSSCSCRSKIAFFSTGC